MDAEKFRKHGKDMIDVVAEYWSNIRDRKPAPDVQPGYLRQLLPSDPPNEGEDWETIFGDLEKVVFNRTTHWHHPHFFAYYPTANSYPAIVGDILSSEIACLGSNWESSPASTELEAIVTDWLAQMLKLPEYFLNSHSGPGAGMIQGSASDATLVALLAARNGLLRNHGSGDLNSVLIPKLVAYTSDQAHSSVERAALLGAVTIRKIQSDENYSMQSGSLEEAIKKDIKDGLIPFFVCATLGTTASCSFDNLLEIGPVCEHYGVWLHIDAAYAGTAFICPEYRHYLDGVEFADSFNFNPHKLMLVNTDCSTMWFKNAKHAERSLAYCDSCYKSSDNFTNIINFKHLQIPTLRRFRALKLWFVMRAFGKSGLQEHVRKHCRLAKEFVDLLETDDRFELGAPLNLGLGDNDLTKCLLKQITDDGRIHLIPSSLGEKFILRLSISSTLTTSNDIRFAWRVISEMATKISE